jgi:hypothetical protein
MRTRKIKQLQNKAIKEAQKEIDKIDKVNFSSKKILLRILSILKNIKTERDCLMEV